MSFARHALLASAAVAAASFASAAAAAPVLVISIDGLRAENKRLVEDRDGLLESGAHLL